MLFGGGLMMAGERRLKRYRARMVGASGGAGGADTSWGGQSGASALNASEGRVPLQFDFMAAQGDLARLVVGQRGRGGRGRTARTDPDARFDASYAPGGNGWRKGGRGGSAGSVGASGYGGSGGGSTGLEVAGVLLGVAPGAPGGKGACAQGIYYAGEGSQYGTGNYTSDNGGGEAGESPPAGVDGSGGPGGGGGYAAGGNGGGPGTDNGTAGTNAKFGDAYSAPSNLTYSGAASDYSVFSGRGIGGAGTTAGTGDGADGTDGRVVIEDVETGQVYVYDVSADIALP